MGLCDITKICKLFFVFLDFFFFATFGFGDVCLNCNMAVFKSLFLPEQGLSGACDSSV